jgi:hypothetical protein
MARPNFNILVLFLILAFRLAVSPSMAVASDEPKKVDSSLTFLAHVETIYINLENGPVVRWVKPIFAVLDSRLVGATKPQTIVVEVTLHPDQPADVIVAARPALSDADTKSVVASSDLATSPRTRVVDGIFRIGAKINGGTRCRGIDRVESQLLAGTDRGSGR